MDIADLRIDAERLRADFDALTEIGATVAGGVSRLALSNEDLEARAWFANRLDDAGLAVRDDDVGNISGVLVMNGTAADRTVLLGAHLDTALNAGRYDGSVGILAALECLRTIHESGIRLPVNLEVINFTDQEGSWHSMLGSRGLTGRLPDFTMRDGDDQSAFRAALFRAGIFLNDMHRAARQRSDVAGYLELHIEQGGRLWAAGKRIGVVEGIVGRTTYSITFHGEAGHSGTTAPEQRRDALQGAAQFIIEAHRWVRESIPDGLFNAGNIVTEPGAFNTIPEKAVLTVEVRNPDQSALLVMEDQMLVLAASCAERYGLRMTSRRLVNMPAAKMDAAVIADIEAACGDIGVTDTARVVSYAGHDAQMLSGFTPTGLIFIPSVDGISHNPREFTEWDDVVLGANVLLHSTIRLAQRV
ncbi:MAG: Zn-dependent hydrolase [Chloroflexi bacterium]|nr:Zn-dependent hydrolase [Chloroflexota bacterium]